MLVNAENAPPSQLSSVAAKESAKARLVRFDWVHLGTLGTRGCELASTLPQVGAGSLAGPK
jgi:hypothetical protein